MITQTHLSILFTFALTSICITSIFHHVSNLLIYIFLFIQLSSPFLFLESFPSKYFIFKFVEHYSLKKHTLHQVLKSLQILKNNVSISLLLIFLKNKVIVLQSVLKSGFFCFYIFSVVQFVLPCTVFFINWNTGLNTGSDSGYTSLE